MELKKMNLGYDNGASKIEITKREQEEIIRVRLDVDIEDSGIELVPLPNQASIGNGLNTKSVVWM